MRIPNLITGKSAKLPGDYAPVTGSHEVAKYTIETPPNNLPSGAVAEYRFCKRQFRMDFAWPEHKVYLEINGGLFGIGKPCPVCGRRRVAGHSSIQRLLKDMEKINLASAMGWRPVFCTPSEFSSGEAARRVEEAIGGTK